MVGGTGFEPATSTMSIWFHATDTKTPHKNWRWEKANELLNPENSEDCISSLAELMPLRIKNEPKKSEDKSPLTVRLDIVYQRLFRWPKCNRGIHGSEGYQMGEERF